MLGQPRFLPEELAAVRTGKWFLPRMKSHVVHEMLFLGETFPTLRAGIGLLSRVHLFMNDKDGPGDEAFAEIGRAHV